MARLYRQCVTRYRLPNGKAVKKGTSGARKSKEHSEKWYCEYTDASDHVRRVPLSPKFAQTMMAELIHKADRERSGRSDPFEAHAKRPLSDHLADYKGDLLAKGNTWPSKSHESRHCVRRAGFGVSATFRPAAFRAT
ncbi:MAG TPA: hypothetical protein VND64_13175 [Pirellulales bacterium]|nr:hypothetical protein [Pirellulales bacterium]